MYSIGIVLYRFFTIAIGGTLGSTQKHDIQFLCTLQYSCTYLTIYFTQKPTEMHLLGHYNYMKILTMQYVDNFNKNFHINQYFVLTILACTMNMATQQVEMYRFANSIQNRQLIHSFQGASGLPI